MAHVHEHASQLAHKKLTTNLRWSLEPPWVRGYGGNFRTLETVRVMFDD